MTYTQLASEEQIARTAQALEANGIHTLVVETGAQARDLFFELVPEGAQVHQGASATLEQLGITAQIETSGRYDAIRPKIRAMDRRTQMDEIRSLSAKPEYMVGSVGAVTEDGRVLAGSASGSQIGPYVYGAKQVILVVGAQKIVPSLAEGFRRLEEYVTPLVSEELQKKAGISSHLNKVLVIQAERPGRITLILVKESLGY